MKVKFIVVLCILFSLRVNVSALSFSPDAFFAVSTSDDDKKKEADDTLDKLIVWTIIFGAITVGLCYYWMNSVQFLEYPYQSGDGISPLDGNYVTRGELDLSYSFMYTQPGYKDSRYSVDTSLVYLDSLGLGNETRFEGLCFPFIGPYFENLALYNSKDFSKNKDVGFCRSGMRDNLKLGGQLSVLQANILSASFLVMYTNWFGTGFSDCNNGIYLGGLLRSYPVKPLVLEWKFGVQLYTSDFQVFESNLQVGIMRNRYEFFAAWKILSFDFDNEEEHSHFGNFNGFTLGTRVYFSI